MLKLIFQRGTRGELSEIGFDGGCNIVVSTISDSTHTTHVQTNVVHVVDASNGLVFSTCNHNL